MRNDRMIHRSALLTSLGIVHAFSTRQGGVSTGRYASLNLGQKWGDDPAAAAENLRRFSVAAGFSVASLCRARQVHGKRVLTIDDALADIAIEEADGLASALHGLALGVATADCVPLLFADGRGRVAAVHAGWRGTVANIAGAAVETLVRLGARVDELRVAFGPSICVDCFEVGREVADQFIPITNAAVQQKPNARPHVDLRYANRRLLEQAGILAAHIDDAPPCTMHEPELFFSFRRDGAKIGQQLSVIIA